MASVNKSAGIRLQSAVRGLSAVLVSSVAVACSVSSEKITNCSQLSSLMRFGTESIDVSSLENIESFLSNGGFIEVYSRKDILGPIDSSRICTAFVEFSENPALAEVDSPEAPLNLKIYTANHCLDLSRDFKVKLYLFDGRIYQDFWLDNSTLTKVSELRKSMRLKGVPQKSQEQLLSAFSVRKNSIEEFFNSSTVQTSAGGAGASNTAGGVCLKKDDPNFQNVCATFQDLTVFRATPDVNSPAVVINKLRKLRSVANTRAARLIGDTDLAKILVANPTLRLTFQDSRNEPHDLVSLHGEVRRRVFRYAQFKNVMNVREVLLEELQRCSVGKGGDVCKFIPEISEVIKAELAGSGYEVFENSKLLYTVDALGSGYNEAFDQVDTAFTVFDSFLKVTSDGGLQIPLTARVHSNFRFVTLAEGTKDRPDPRDSIASGRGFMHFNANNMTADSSGEGVTFISWVSSEQDPSSALQGRFMHMKFPREITPEVAAKQNNDLKHIGYMQEGDSGSIVVIEQMPYFAITSVDGKATAGGAALRPLPEPIDEAEIEAAVSVASPAEADGTAAQEAVKSSTPRILCR